MFKQSESMDGVSKAPSSSPTVSIVPKQEPASTIGTVVAFYFAISMAVVFLNKVIFSYSSFVFPYPITVTWFQLVVALVGIYVWGEYAKVSPRDSVWSVMPEFKIEWSIAVKILPLTGIYVAMIVFNNLCLQYVEVSFYQVARSLTLIFNVIFSYYILGTTVSTKGLVSCGIVFVGYILASIGEMSVTLHGLVYGLLSSVFVALYSIYVKDKLSLLGDNQWKLLQYNTLLAVFLLFPFTILTGEMLEVMHFEHLLSPMFWSTMTFAAVMGLLINIAIFMQIKYTSPLTNTISGTAKACLQTLLGVYIFGNEVSPLNAFGTIVCIGGSAYYSFVRYQEMTCPH
eukprot:TRINITY_DN5214_c0_g1_i3.p1 TRINITY_DN5214_c0_g1~~TRINITY_DN5214_c0_g1_i3.p1  ORF type:complete len:342 (+),score=69.55 TRINITY_DN5214_c0_g1_i3:83-1108(+)